MINIKSFEKIIKELKLLDIKERLEYYNVIYKNIPCNPLMSKKEVASLLNCSARQVDYLRENYNMPWLRLGEVIRFDAEKVQKWLKTQDGTGTSSVPSLQRKHLKTKTKTN